MEIFASSCTKAKLRLVKVRLVHLLNTFRMLLKITYRHRSKCNDIERSWTCNDTSIDLFANHTNSSMKSLSTVLNCYVSTKIKWEDSTFNEVQWLPVYLVLDVRIRFFHSFKCYLTICTDIEECNFLVYK